MLEDLINRAKQVRDEIEEEANTTMRIGGLFLDIVIWISEQIQSLTNLVNNLEKDKQGYKSTIAKLKADLPNPESGWYAYVGETGTIWEVSNGQWVDSKKPIPEELVDFDDFIKKEDLGIQPIVGDNSFDINEITAGKSLDGSTGAEINNNFAFISNYIPINQGDTITFNSDRSLVLYALDKSILKVIPAIGANPTQTERSIIVDGGYYFVRFTVMNEWLNTFYCYITDSDAPMGIPMGRVFYNGVSLDELVDSGYFIKKEDLEKVYSDNEDTAPASSLLNKLNNDLYNNEGGIKEIIPYTGLTARISEAPFNFFYVNHAILKGKNIAKVKVNIAKAGTMSILFAKNVSSETDFSFTKQVFDVTKGINEIAVNKQLGADETIGFFDFGDTATFTFGASNTTNPIGGNMTQRNENGTWATPNPTLDLSIGVYEKSNLPSGDIPTIKERLTALEDSADGSSALYGKSFSVLGDSISTFQGMIPSGHATFYPNSNVTDWLQTWWGLLTTDKYGMKLVANASYSGGTLTSGTGGTSIPDFVSKLGEKPDYIFLFMGTNDYTRKVAIGELNFYSFDKSKFIQAACDLINNTFVSYPNSRIVLMSPLQRNPSTATNGKNPNKIADNDVNFLFDYKDAYERVSQIYGVQFIDMFKCGISFYNIDTYLFDKLHPNALGMELIADYVYKNISLYAKM